MKAITDGIRKGTGIKPWRIEGYEQLNWVLLDYVDAWYIFLNLVNVNIISWKGCGQMRS